MTDIREKIEKIIHDAIVDEKFQYNDYQLIVDAILKAVREEIESMTEPEDQDFIFKEKSPSKNYNQALTDLLAIFK